MQITPRYEGPPVIDLDAVVDDPSGPFLRQRTRLVEVLGGLTTDEWRAPSRCAGWTTQDVVEHLAGVSRFWLFSFGAGLGGAPTRILASFDPVAVPAAMVDAARGDPPTATLGRLDAANMELAELLGARTTAEWSTLAEAPPGHLALRAAVAHALWDSWIHERDILLPLSREPSVEPDEVTLALAYAAAIGPAFRATIGATESGTLDVEARRPDVRLSIDVGAVVEVRQGGTERSPARIEGSAVELIEGLSFRGPPPVIDDDHRWMLEGLDAAFEVGSSPGGS